MEGTGVHQANLLGDSLSSESEDNDVIDEEVVDQTDPVQEVSTRLSRFFTSADTAVSSMPRVPAGTVFGDQPIRPASAGARRDATLPWKSGSFFESGGLAGMRGVPFKRSLTDGGTAAGRPSSARATGGRPWSERRSRSRPGSATRGLGRLGLRLKRSNTDYDPRGDSYKLSSWGRPNFSRSASCSTVNSLDAEELNQLRSQGWAIDPRLFEVQRDQSLPHQKKKPHGVDGGPLPPKPSTWTGAVDTELADVGDVETSRVQHDLLMTRSRLNDFLAMALVLGLVACGVYWSYVWLGPMVLSWVGVPMLSYVLPLLFPLVLCLMAYGLYWFGKFCCGMKPNPEGFSAYLFSHRTMVLAGLGMGASVALATAAKCTAVSLAVGWLAPLVAMVSLAVVGQAVYWLWRLAVGTRHQGHSGFVSANVSQVKLAKSAKHMLVWVSILSTMYYYSVAKIAPFVVAQTGVAAMSALVPIICPLLLAIGMAVVYDVFFQGIRQQCKKLYALEAWRTSPHFSGMIILGCVLPLAMVGIAASTPMMLAQFAGMAAAVYLLVPTVFVTAAVGLSYVIYAKLDFQWGLNIEAADRQQVDQAMKALENAVSPMVFTSAGGGQNNFLLSEEKSFEFDDADGVLVGSDEEEDYDISMIRSDGPDQLPWCLFSL